MGWSLKLGKILGIDIKVHFTFLLIVVWGAFNYGGSAGPWYGVLVTLIIFLIVLLHELGHSVAALAFGIPVKDITLLPIGGVARLEKMPEKPFQELVVALAGPLVNVILAAILLPVVIVLMYTQQASLTANLMSQPGLLGLSFFLLVVNVSLLLFNMLPAFPLDGGRVFRATLGFFTSYERSTRIAVIVGRVLAVGLGLFAFLGPQPQFWLAMIALFIFFAGGQEGTAVATRSKLKQVQVGQILGRDPIVLSLHDTVGQAASLMANNYQSNFAVLDPLSGRLMGFISSRNIAQAMAQGEWYLRVSEIMQHVGNVPIVGFYAGLDEVQEKLAQTSYRVAAVYDGLNFRGLISLEDIARTFRFLPRRESSA
jgi:Zn-dependent protease/CBS domain-containing protein